MNDGVWFCSVTCISADRQRAGRIESSGHGLSPGPVFVLWLLEGIAKT